MKVRLLLLAWIITILFPPLGGQEVAREPDSLGVNRRMLTTALLTESAVYLGGMSYLQFIWYKDHERVPFHFYNDNKGYLQIDKAGHAFGAYIESYISYHWLRAAGVSKGRSLLFGGTLGLLMQTPIEIFDGLYEGWGFSWGDMVANAAGSLFVIGQELLFDRQLMKYKLTYWESPYTAQANGYLGTTTLNRFFYDYNGHTYWLSVPLKSLIPWDRIPDWLNVAAGYSANGMFGEFKNIRYYKGVWIPETERYRQFLFSLDVDWTRIPTRSRFLKGLFQALVFIKVPFPTIEFNSLGSVKGYWLYY
ncbi:MAG: DUF2279 domain-containing protein [Bacteroidales bacterium]